MTEYAPLSSVYICPICRYEVVDNARKMQLHFLNHMLDVEKYSIQDYRGFIHALNESIRAEDLKLSVHLHKMYYHELRRCLEKLTPRRLA